ncbi:MAG: CRTAC1 family protein [Bacteroidia bacterium]|nr:CRTAC1 family protein [Bacteroidia bacterium]
MTQPEPDQDQDDGIIGRATWWSLAAVVALGAVGTGAWLLLRKPAPVREPDPTPVTPALPRVVDQPMTAVPFTDIAKAAGIDFIHTTGASGEFLLPETMGGGVGFLDVDADGDQDLVLIDGCRWQGEPFSSEPEPDHDSVRLWTNDGRGQFREATNGSGLEGPRYGMGIATGDLDGDGRTDLFVTAVGRNAVYLNRTERGGGPRFEDATDRLNVPRASRWGTSAAMVDGDQDGDLDVIVCNYVRWSREIDLAVDYRLTGIGRAYGSPTGFEGVDLTYLRNDGAAGLVDATAESGFAVANASTGKPVGKALGVVLGDWNGDGRVDVAIANDTVANFLFRNEGSPGRASFVEVGAPSGIAFDRNGSATGAMGIDTAWLRPRQWAIAIGNFANEMSSLYVERGTTMSFSDDAIIEGLGPASRAFLTFGLVMADMDLDGDADLVQANGHIEERIAKVQPSQAWRQRGQLFLNAGRGAPSPLLRELPAGKIGDLARPVVGRGLATADIDGDGDLDLALTQAGGAPMLLRNDLPAHGRWLRIVLEGPPGNPQGIGALVTVAPFAAEPSTTAATIVSGARSYLSACDPAFTIGLPEGQTRTVVTVSWPAGSRSTPESRVVVDGSGRSILIRASDR